MPPPVCRAFSSRRYDHRLGLPPRQALHHASTSPQPLIGQLVTTPHSDWLETVLTTPLVCGGMRLQLWPDRQLQAPQLDTSPSAETGEREGLNWVGLGM